MHIMPGSSPVFRPETASPVAVQNDSSGSFNYSKVRPIKDSQRHSPEPRQNSGACLVAGQDEFMSAKDHKYWRVKKHNEGCSVEFKYLQKSFRWVPPEFSPRVVVPIKDGGKFSFIFEMDPNENGLKLSPHVILYENSLKPDSDCMRLNMESLDIPKDRIAFFDHLTMDVSLLDSAGNKISDIDLHTFHFAGEDQENGEAHCESPLRKGSGVSVMSVNCLSNPERLHCNSVTAVSLNNTRFEVDQKLKAIQNDEHTKMWDDFNLKTTQLDAEQQRQLKKLEDEGADQLKFSELKHRMEEEESIAFTRAENEMTQKFLPDGEFYDLVKAMNFVQKELDQHLQEVRSNCKACIKHSTEGPLYEQWIQQISKSSGDCKDLRIKVEFKSSKNSTE